SAGMALPLAVTMACRLSAGGMWQGKSRISRTGATRGRKPSAETRAAVSPAPGSGRVIRTPGLVSGKDVARAVGAQAGAQVAADPFGVARRAAQAALQQE